MAKPARLAPRKGKNFTAHASAGSTFGVAHAGRVFALLGVGPNNLDGADPADRVEQTARKLLATPPAELPRPLAQHLAKSADLSLYLNGESIAELLRLNWPPDQWKALLPALGPLLQGKLSARLTAQTGRVVLDIEDPDKPSDNGEENKVGPASPCHAGRSPLATPLSSPRSPSSPTPCGPPCWTPSIHCSQAYLVPTSPPTPLSQASTPVLANSSKPLQDALH